MADKNSAARRAGLGVGEALAPVRRQAGNAADAFSTALSLGLNHQANRVAVRDFVGGLLGNDANSAAAALTAPRSVGDVGKGSVTVNLPDAKPAAAATAKLTAKDLTPAERQAAFVDSLFRHPLTIEQAVAATGIMQKPDKQRTNKDSIIPDLVNQSTELYKEAVAQATAEPDTAKAQEMLTQARKDHFNRVLPLAGGNPLNVASAGLIDQDPS